VKDQTAPNPNGRNTPPAKTSPPKKAVKKTVPKIIQNFRATFESMSKQLRFGRVKDDKGEPKELGESDIRGFISDIMKFSDYIDEWEHQTWATKEADLSGISLQCLQESLPNIVAELNTALKVAVRLKPTDLDIVQFDKGSRAYLTRFIDCSKLITDMLKNCFLAID
jgi:hypothetical protein